MKTGSLLRIIIYNLTHTSRISKRELVSNLIFTVNLATNKSLNTTLQLANHYRVSVLQDDRVLEICWTTQCLY